MTACLVFAASDGPRTLVVDRPLIVGRDHDCDVHFDDARMSRRHARVFPAGGAVQVLDLGSRNGTFVNGKVVKAARLADGDVIQVGRASLHCHLGEHQVPASEDGVGNTDLDGPAGIDAAVTRLLPRGPSGANAARPAAEMPAPAPALMERSLGDVARSIRAACRRRTPRFGSSNRFTMAWRRRLLALWLLGSAGVLAVPCAWVATAVSRQEAQQGRLAAGLLAAAAVNGEAADRVTLDALVVRVMGTTGLAGVTFLDERCVVLAPSARAGVADATLDCGRLVRSEPVSWRDGGTTVSAAKVPAAVPGGVAWVVTRSKARNASARPFLLTQAAGLLIVTLAVWMTSKPLCGRVFSLLDAFADSAGVAARNGAERLGSGYPLPALDRIAGIIDFLAVRPPRTPSSGGPEAARFRPAPANRPPAAAPAPPPLPLAPAPATLVVNRAFCVERAHGDGAAFGLAAVTSSRHILDVLQGDPALTNTVLGMLAAHGRSPDGSSAVELCTTAAGDRICVEVVVSGASLELRFARDDESRGGHGG